MEPPHLKLIILQGPRQGETLGFEPSKVVKIGRIIRNNTFSIKDAGISSNHLSISVESSTKWVLRDLDSSNGTFLNGSKIPPNTPFDLRHGDNIKIGESTSIRVDLLAQEGSCVRRNPRRQITAKGSGTVREKLEEEEEKLVERKRGRPRKGKGLKSEVGEEFSEVQFQNIDENVEVGGELKDVVFLQEKMEPHDKRATRNSKKKKQQQQLSVIGTSMSGVLKDCTENSELKSGVGEEFSKVQLQGIDENVGVGDDVKNVVLLQEKVEPPGKKRVTRNSKKPQQQHSGVIGTSNSSMVTDSAENSGLKSGVGEEFGKVQLQGIDEDVEVDYEVKNVVLLHEKVEQPVNKRATRNLKKQQQSVIGTSNSSIVTNSIDNSSLRCTEEKIVEKKTTRAGTRRRKLQEDTSLCDQVAISEDVVQEARDNTEANQNPSVEEVEEDESKKDCCSAKEAGSDKRRGEEACSSQRKDSNENGDWPDLDNLTLDEWFDFLEIHLPKQIIDATEEMIDSMKEKAERVRDYMAKQRNDKGTLPVG